MLPTFLFMANQIDNTSVKKSKAPLYISLLLLASLIACYFAIPEVKDFFNEAWSVLTSNDKTRIEQWVSNFGWLGPVIIILAMVLQMFLLVIPSVLLMVVAILAYGPIWGSLIAFSAIYVASSVGYLLGNYFGPVLIERLIGQKTENKIADFIDDYGFWAVIIARLNPFLSNDAISFVAGILKMGYWKYIGATLAGIAPLTFFIAVMGKSTDSLKNGLLWGSIVSLVIFAGYVYWDKKRKKS